MKAFNLTLKEGSRINNLTVPSGTSFPSNANAGEMFYLTSGSVGMYVHNGSSWILLTTSVSKILRQTVTTSNGIWTISLSNVNSVINVSACVLPTTTFVPRFNAYETISTTTLKGRIYEIGGLGLAMSSSSAVSVIVTLEYT